LGTKRRIRGIAPHETSTLIIKLSNNRIARNIRAHQGDTSRHSRAQNTLSLGQQFGRSLNLPHCLKLCHLGQ